MFNKIRQSYEHTIYASYVGYITQAIVNNFVPLLFVAFTKTFSLSIEQITFITTLNFAVQLLIDLLSATFVDKIGYRTCLIAAHLFSATGLLGLAFLPELVGNAYGAILVSVVLYAIGGGLIEVLISPVVEACPTKKKEAAMSLLHSFYCWGHVGVVLVSTAFFALFGIENWSTLAAIWALVPLCNCFYFALVPIYKMETDSKNGSFGGLFKNKVFWNFMIIMICAGASEQAMSQWASAFAESALQVSKTVGDLAGPCAFALLMGTARAIYGKCSDRLPLRNVMICSAFLCIGCYVLAVVSTNPIFGLIGCALCGFSVGIFWPGTFSMAAEMLPGAGTAMYALMALAGDIGCSAGPTLVGCIADSCGGNLKPGLATAMIFPVAIIIGIALLQKKSNSRKEVA